jgi:hypothetical protein
MESGKKYVSDSYENCIAKEIDIFILNGMMI